MTPLPELTRRRPSLGWHRCALGILAGGWLWLPGCATMLELGIETPVQSKIDMSRFRRLLVAGFVVEPGAADVELQAETVRLLQNNARSGTKLEVLDADRPPIQEALERATGQGEDTSPTDKGQVERFRLETDKVLQDTAFWRRVGEEFQSPLILTGRIGFVGTAQSGFESEERVVRDAYGRARVVQGNRFLERKGFTLSAEFHFLDGQTGQLLHKERFTEEVLYSEEQKVSPLSSYFELMDRVLPNILGVIAPQRIRGTRVLLY